MASNYINNVPVDESRKGYNMESDVYWEAAKAKIGPAIKRNTRRLAQLRTPNGSTILHICITSAKTLADDKTNKKKTTDDNDLEASRIKLEGEIEICIEPDTTMLADAQTNGNKSSSHDEGEKFVEKVLEMCPELLMKANKNGETPLHLAARYGNARIVKLLIERAKALHNEDIAKEMLMKPSQVEDTALHEAARFNHLNEVEILTREDPDHYKYPPNKAGEIPLFIAVERGYRQVVLEILRGSSAPPNGDLHARNALHAAAIVGDEGEIIEKWRELSKETDDKGWTALHYAAEGKSALTVKKLLEFEKSAAYVQDLEGKTALHIAARKGHEKIMKEIISECPDCCDLVDNRDRNVLHFAVESNRYEAVQVITDEYSLSHLLNATDNEGNTPLHLIANDRILQAFVDLCRVDHNLVLNSGIQNALDINKGKHMLDHDDEEDDEKYTKALAEIEKAHESTLITSALIATVTFAAAFTMPGGYASGDSAEMKAGTPILAKSKAFQAFIITDTLAMVVSSAAVYYHVLVVLGTSKLKKVESYNWAVYLTTYALAAMLIAFVTGTYAVLESPQLGLAIFLCVLGSFFAFPYFVHSCAFFLKVMDPNVPPVLK